MLPFACPLPLNEVAVVVCLVLYDGAGSPRLLAARVKVAGLGASTGLAPLVSLQVGRTRNEVLELRMDHCKVLSRNRAQSLQLQSVLPAS
jgi:hypothetical protein